MKRLFSIFILSLTILSLTAQEFVISSEPLIPEGDKVPVENLDLATVKVYYLFTQLKENPNRDILRNDTMSLHIGPQISYYFDETKSVKDSIATSLISNFNPNMIQSISIIKDGSEYDGVYTESSELSHLDGTTEKLYKNRETGDVFLIDKSSELTYKCKDQAVKFDWLIGEDTTTVLGYVCQKATTRFRGRNYEAWFAPELPINDGPWKFMGLPGLILKVEDDENFIRFESVGLEYLDEPYQIQIPEGKYINCGRKEFAKMMLKKGGGISFYVNGGNITLVQKTLDPAYKPIEKE